MTNNISKKQLERRMLTEMQILCNACGIPLLSSAEAKIGVHVSCVQEANSRPSFRIARPSYGTNSRKFLDAERVPPAASKR